MFFRHHVALWTVSPAVHVQVHPLSLFKPPKVGCHLGLFHGLTLQVSQAFHKLNALVVLAADEGLLCSLQVQLLERSLGQQSPKRQETGWQANYSEENIWLQIYPNPPSFSNLHTCYITYL